MEKMEAIRKPRQKRSIETKQKIRDAAYRLFCEKGYYETTTNEIAREAEVSIGSLYSYYADKDTIFFDILERYHESFVEIHSRLAEKLDASQADLRSWLAQFIEGMIQVHRASKDLNQEINMLCYSKPEVKAVVDRHRDESCKLIYEYLLQTREKLWVIDLEAAAELFYNLISATVDEIVFSDAKIDQKRLIDACLDALERYLLK